MIQHSHIKDDEIERLRRLNFDLQKKVEDDLFVYKPLREDPIDQRLAHYINAKPLRMRSKMHFERES